MSVVSWNEPQAHIATDTFKPHIKVNVKQYAVLLTMQIKIYIRPLLE